MFRAKEKPVMDVQPWPNGMGFKGRESWWDHVLSKDEAKRLDYLMGLALLDADIHDRLVRERDDSLLSAFGLSRETKTWLQNVQANTLTELAQAIVDSANTKVAVPVAP